MQLPLAGSLKIDLPAVTSAATRFVGARGERMVFIQLLMSIQSGITVCLWVLVPMGSPISALDPWSPICCGSSVSWLMRSVAAGLHLSVTGLHTLLPG